MRNDFFKHILLSGGSRQNRTELETETLPYTFNSNSYRLRNYRIYGNTVNGESVGNLVTEGEHAGEYCVPVTITNGTESKTNNIYLPEQIRKVGDHAEYVDYRKQKQHRVRKNLCPYESINNSIIGNVTIGNTYTFSFYALHECGYNLQKRNADSGSTSPFITPPSHITGKTSVTFTADENFDVYFNGYSQTTGLSTIECITEMQLEKGSVATPYEPYITDTELDVSLPALPTLSGTNTLSVGTEVQPSKVYLQGKISEAEIVSAEPVQTNVQSLQPLSLDNENAETDVMLIETGDDNSGFSDT